MIIFSSISTISHHYSSWSEITYWALQGLSLGSLLLNFFICDLFLITDDFQMANYADDTTPYVYGDDLTSVIKSLEHAANTDD